MPGITATNPSRSAFHELAAEVDIDRSTSEAYRTKVRRRVRDLALMVLVTTIRPLSIARRSLYVQHTVSPFQPSH
jgi:hypothetical protein